MSPASNPSARRILVADEDPAVVSFVVHCLRGDGHFVFHAYDALAATQLAFSLKDCHLVITNTRVGGVAGVDLIEQLRSSFPALPIIYIANQGRSTPELEARLPAEIPVLRDPFGADELRAMVNEALADGDGRRVVT